MEFDGFGYSGLADALDHMTQQSDGVFFSDQGQDILFWGTQLSDFTDEIFGFV